MYQSITIVGYLGGNPEMRYFPDGTAVTNFSVATSRKWTGNDGEKKEETTWFGVSVFGRQAEACNQYLQKGSLVLVEGRLKPDKATGSPRLWTRNDGTVRASYEVQAGMVRFLGGGSGDPAPTGGNGRQADPVVEEDEIPF